MNSILKQFWDYDNIVRNIHTIQILVEPNIHGNSPIWEKFIFRQIDGGIV
jgi:hypothetical protein